MIDSLMNLLFRCGHKRLTRPVTPVARTGAPPPGETYVVCLDCGQHFSYDAKNMRLGKRIVEAVKR
jgi:DNA-directed RNA polymerase subunit RPC12/RpoP